MPIALTSVIVLSLRSDTYCLYVTLYKLPVVTAFDVASPVDVDEEAYAYYETVGGL